MRAQNLRLRAGLAPHLGHNVAAAYQARNLVLAAQRCAPPVARVSIHLHICHSVMNASNALGAEYRIVHFISKVRKACGNEGSGSAEQPTTAAAFCMLRGKGSHKHVRPHQRSQAGRTILEAFGGAWPTTALASRRLRGEGSIPARERSAFTMDEWLPVFMEKMGCPAARADMISASSPPFTLSRVVSTASASCIGQPRLDHIAYHRAAGDTTVPDALALNAPKTLPPNAIVG